LNQQGKALIHKALNFSPAPLLLKAESDCTMVQHLISKKWLVCTPEEWVRQHMLHFLMAERGFPSGLIATEQKLKVGRLNLRFDILVADRNGEALLVCECKAYTIPLTEKVMMQAANYNRVLQAPYMLVTNGMDLKIFSLDKKMGTYVPISNVPTWETIVSNPSP
jgi:hypothetical protein